ncbi:hypothetical protein D3C81_1491430 [compost metagenome]
MSFDVNKPGRAYKYFLPGSCIKGCRLLSQLLKRIDIHTVRNHLQLLARNSKLGNHQFLKPLGRHNRHIARFCSVELLRGNVPPGQRILPGYFAGIDEFFCQTSMNGGNKRRCLRFNPPQCPRRDDILSVD